jgi:Cu/Ag efflux pump CusA
VVALTVTPVLCSLLLPAAARCASGLRARPGALAARAYERACARALPLWPCGGPSPARSWRSPRRVARRRRAFLPEFNEGALTIAVVTLPRDLARAVQPRSGHGREDPAAHSPRSSSSARRTGRAELDEHAQGVNAAEVEVSPRDEGPQRGRSSRPAPELRGVPGMNIVIGQPISHRIDHMLSGTRANIAVKIFGPDLLELRRLARAGAAQVDGVPGVVDLSVEQQSNLPFARRPLRSRRDRAHGLRSATSPRPLETAFYGRVVSQVLAGAYAFDLVVRYPDVGPRDLERLSETLIATPSGAVACRSACAREDPQATVAEHGQPRERAAQDRRHVQRRGARPRAGSCSTSAVASRAPLSCRRATTYEYGGQFESAAEASSHRWLLGIAAVIGIFLLLLAFRLGTRRALVMLNLPLALIGGVVGVFVSGGCAECRVLIGFITVFGIATRNGIMLVSHIKHLEEHEGVTDFREAVRRGAMERLAPILMTALAAGLGLVL